MECLLDTHIWLWSELEPHRLPAVAAAALRSPGNRLWLSPLSVWEMSRLALRSRISIDLPWQEWLRLSHERTAYREAPLTMEVAAATGGIQLPHRDPMDWLLAATARHYRLTLVTADAQLLAGTGFVTLRPQ